MVSKIYTTTFHTSNNFGQKIFGQNLQAALTVKVLFFEEKKQEWPQAEARLT